MKTYHLYSNPNNEKHYLVIFNRSEVNRSNEDSIREAVNNELDSVKTCIAKYDLDALKIGIMEDFPIGDSLFECSSGKHLDIWYSKNIISPDFLILGTAENVDEFHEEATADYDNMVGVKEKHKNVSVLVLNAI